MDYSKYNFDKLVERLISTQAKLPYIGQGNPNSNILILGKESAINPKKDEDQYRREIANNYDDWKNIISSGLSLSDVPLQMCDNVVIGYNPLYPYKGQYCKIRAKGGTSSTWYWYQRIVDEIMGKPQKNKNEYIDYFYNSFITEVSTATGKMSRDVDKDERKLSINERAEGLLSNNFFKHFQIIIAACSSYVGNKNGVDLVKLFDVPYKGVYKFKDDKWTLFKYPNKGTGKYWIHVHESIDGIPRIVLHTYQLSQPSKDYIRGVVEICKEFIARNKIIISNDETSND